MKYIFILFFSIPFIMGATCKEDPVVVLQKVVIEAPPKVKALIPNPIEKVFNVDGSYCTNEKQTGNRFDLFVLDSKIEPVEDWESESQFFNIWISSEGVFDLLNYFKETVCAESIIECTGFSPTSFTPVAVASAEEQKILDLINSIHKILEYKSDDTMEVLSAKYILQLSFRPLNQMGIVAIKSIQARGTVNDEI